MFETLLTPDAILNYLAFAALMFFPLCMIFKRAGFPIVYGVYVFAPYAGMFICLGILGLKHWPNEPPKPEKA